MVTRVSSTTGLRAFDHLVQLYERDGYLQEALKVAEIANQFGQGEKALERLKAKLAEVESEDAA